MESLFRIIRKQIPVQGQASAFGVVLLTDRHANLRKVLNDDDYCKALHDISGSRWTVFVARAKPGRTEIPSFPPGTIGMMYMRWVEPRENAELIAALGLNSTQSLPCLVVLFPDEDGNALTHIVRLDDKTLEEAFASLKDSIGAVTEAIDGVLPENLKNAEGIHAAVALRLESVRHWRFVKKALPFLVWVRRLAL